VAAAALVAAHAQQQPPTFGTTTRTVAVYATVTDAQGRLAPDLTRAAFEVDDNGVKQDLTVFSNDIQPITGILLLDRSGSMKPNLELEVRAADTFIPRNAQGRSAPHRQLRQRHHPRAGRLHVGPRQAGRTPARRSAERRPDALWNAIDRAIDKLLLEKGRRVVLAFSDGVDEPLDFSGRAKSMKDEMKRAEDSDIMIYSSAWKACRRCSRAERRASADAGSCRSGATSSRCRSPTRAWRRSRPRPAAAISS